MRLFLAIAVMLVYTFVPAQTTLLQYNFEGATTYPVSPNATASGITCSATSSEAFTSFGGTNTGSGAFTADNSSAGTALAMSNSSGTNTRYFQFQLGGTNLSCYKCFKIYFQAQRSTSGATTITLQYSTDGTTYTTFGTTATVGTSFTECNFDLCSITALDNPSAVYFRLYASGASSTGTLRIDNFQVRGTSLLTGSLSTASYTLNCATATAVVSYTAQCANAGNVYNVLLSDAGGGFSSPTTVGTLTSTTTTGTISVTIPSNLPTGTAYAFQVTSSNPSMSSNATTSFSVTNSCNTCPSLTGAIVDACNSGCNEGDAEVLFFNMGTYSVSVASLPSHLVNYYGSTTNFNSGTINAYTGTFSANATTTSALNATTGCSGSFIDATSVGTIPAGATVMMVPSTFCGTNYNFSNLCSSFSPIYVLYFSTAGWNTSGNLANQQSPSPQLKYLSVNWSAVNSNCATQYYNYDAASEAGSDGAAISFPGSISNQTSAQTSPNNYTTSNCALPAVLPLGIILFKAYHSASGEAEIEFITVHEEQLQRFAVSKSYDGKNYSPLSEVNPSNTYGQHRYVVNDALARETNYVYYRLEEVDINGSRKVVSYCVLEGAGEKELTIVQDENEARIYSPLALSDVHLYSAEGRIAGVHQPEAEETSCSLSLSALSKGFYFVSVTDISGKTVVKKIVR